MTRLYTWKLLLPALTLLLITSCGQEEEASVAIPLSTESEEAREAYLQGLEALDYGRQDDARMYFDSAIEADPDFAIAYFYRARVANSAEEWKRLTDFALQNRTGASAAEQMMIDMLPMYMKDDREMILEQTKDLVDAYPESPRVRLSLAAAYDGVGDIAQKRAAIEKAIALDETFAPAHRMMATSMIFDDPTDYALAEEHAGRYVELQPEEADAHIVLGDTWRAQSQLEKAREAYGKAIEVDPSHPTAYSKRGHANTFLGSYDEARADFEQAIDHAIGMMKISSANFGVYTFIYAGDLDAALRANTAVTDGLPGMLADDGAQRQARISCLRDRVHIAAAAGDFDAAREAFADHAELQREVISIMNSPELTASTEAELVVLEGWTAAREGDLESAMMHADRAAELLAEINNPRKLEGVHALKGYAMLQTGDAKTAIEHFDQSSQGWITVTFYRARAEEALGNDDRAQELYREVANWNFNSLWYAFIRGEAVAKIQG